jgi:hypothetical protein
MVWTISHPSLDSVRDVCGFKSEHKALDHFLKHFLNEEESWQQLVDELSPRHLRRLLSEHRCSLSKHPRDCAAAKKCDPVIQKGVTAYVGAVKDACSRVAGAAVVLRHDSDRDDPFRKHVRSSLAVATSDGVFAAFENAVLSHLATAFRPAPVDGTGRARRQDFRQSAIRQLKKSIDESKALERRLGRTVKEFIDE